MLFCRLKASLATCLFRCYYCRRCYRCCYCRCCWCCCGGCFGCCVRCCVVFDFRNFELQHLHLMPNDAHCGHAGTPSGWESERERETFAHAHAQAHVRIIIQVEKALRTRFAWNGINAFVSPVVVEWKKKKNEVKTGILSLACIWICGVRSKLNANSILVCGAISPRVSANPNQRRWLIR